MTHNPYQSPESKVSTVQENQFNSYSDVPFYRRQWFFWVMFFTIQPIAIIILMTGNVYFVKNEEVVPFSFANRIVAGLFAVFIIYGLLSQ